MAAVREPMVVTIYEPLVAAGYEWINICRDEDYETLLALNGERLGAKWTPVKVRLVRADGRHEFRSSDFPWLGRHALVMRRTAVDALRELLEAHGEILPLATLDGVELYVFNCGVVDALNEELSSVVRFPGSSRIMTISRVSFVPDAVRGVDIFRLPHRASSTYVSQRFVEHVNAAGLRGLEFTSAWTG
jgi:hypothetical protein